MMTPTEINEVNVDNSSLPNDSPLVQTDNNEDDASHPEGDIDDHSALKMLKQELLCPVCFKIPDKLPVPSCPSGHIICQECKNLLPQQSCPVCRTPLGTNTNNLASKLISNLTDLPCNNMSSGCSFRGSIDTLADHKDNCGFEMILCLFCQTFVRKFDFEILKHLNCNADTAGMDIFLPTFIMLEPVFYLVQEDNGKNILILVNCDWLGGVVGISLPATEVSLERSSFKLKLILERSKENPTHKILLILDVSRMIINSKNWMETSWTGKDIYQAEDSVEDIHDDGSIVEVEAVDEDHIAYKMILIVVPLSDG